MNRSFTRSICRIAFFFCTLTIGFLSSADAQTVTVSRIAHETITQNQIEITYTTTNGATGVTFSGAGNPAFWTVTLNGVSAPVTAVAAAGFVVRLTIDPSALPGHAAPPANYILPTETGNVKVSYVGGTGAGKLFVLPLASGNNGPAITTQQSVNNWALGDCADFGFSNQGIIPSKTVDQCAPVTVDFYQYQFYLSMRVRNSTAYNASLINVKVEWNDPSFTASYALLYPSDVAGAPSTVPTANYVSSASMVGGSGPAILSTARPSFSYPASYSLTAPKACEFDAVVQPVYAGINLCTTGILTIPTTFLSYDVDNKNTGTLNLPPSVVNSNRVCLGTNVSMFFSDNTLLNCRSNVQSSGANTLARWVRFVYGSTNYSSPSNIPDIRVVAPAAFGGATTQVTNNNASGSIIVPGGWYPTGGGGTGLPDANGVITLPLPVTAATATAYLGKIITTLTNNQVLGQRFYVRMDYWDVCNPYDGFTTTNAVSIENWVEIVSKPANLTTAGLALCYTTPSSTASNFIVTGTDPAESAINWYNKNPKLPGATKMTNSLGANSTTFKSSDYTAANAAIGAPFKSDNTTGAYYSVWATQVVSSALSCESSPIEIAIIQQPKLVDPLAPAGTATVCNGTGSPGGGTVVAYTEGNPITSKNIPTTQFSNGVIINLTSDYVWNQGFGAGVSLSSGSGVSTNATYNITPQPNPSVAANISIFEQYKTTPTIPIANPNGPPDAVATYNIAPLACVSNTKQTLVTVYGQTVPGSVSPTTKALCDGITTGTLTLSGQLGTVLRWESTFNGGPPTAIAGTGGVTTFAGEVPPNGAGTYTYYAVVRNNSATGPCATQNSAPVTITVNPSPTASVFNGTATICSGTSTDLTVSITSGTSPFKLTYKANGGPDIVVNGYTSGGIITVSPTVTTTYTLVSVVDNTGCPSQGLSGSPVVTISNPATATISGGANICPGATTNLAVAIAGGIGATPYTVTLKANGVDMAPIAGYNDGDPIPVNPLVTTTYTIKQVLDNNNCPALSLLPVAGVKVTVGSTPTAAALSGGATVCKGSTVSIKLNITGGVGPYDVTVTPDVGPQIKFAKATSNAYVNNSAITVPTSAVGTINYSVTFIADNCGNPLVGTPTGNPQTVIVTDVPTASATTTVSTLCSKSNTNIDIATVSSVSIPSTYAWTAAYDAGITGGAASGTGPNIVSGALINATGAVKNATFTILASATAGGCTGIPFTIIQPINSEPFGADKSTAAQCSNSAFSFDPQTTSVATAAGGNNIASTFTWSGSYPAGLTVITAGTGTGNVAEKLENVTGGVINATYTVTPKATATGCVGNTFKIIVPVNPQPFGADKSTAAQCSNSAYSFNPQTVSVATAAGGNNVASTFAWTAAFDPGLTGGTASGTGNITGPVGLTNTSGGVLNVVYTITPKSTAGLCVGNTFTITVPINAKAVVSAQPTTVNACIGDNISFSVTATGPGITYQWQENGANLADGTVSTVTYGGTTTATLTVSNVTSALNGKNYGVILTTTGSCNVASTAVPLVVSTLPPANNVTPKVCSDVPGGSQAVVDLTSNKSAINSGAVTVTYWQAYDAPTKTFSSPITPGSAPGQDQAYTVTNGDVIYAQVVSGVSCVNSATVTYTVSPRPNDNVIKDGTGNTLATVVTSPVRFDLCSSTSSILFQTDGTINPGSTFTWTVPAVSYANEFTVVAASANIIVLKFPNTTEGNALSLYKVTGIPITVTEKLNGCVGNPVTINVHILSAPAPSVISGDASVCDGGSASYSVTNVGGSTYSWTLPPGAVITSLPVTANAITVQMSSFSGSVTVVSSNGTCLSAPAAPFPVTIIPRPVLSTTVNPICSGSLVSSGVTLSANLAGSTFNWEVLSIAGNITGSNVGDAATNVLAINQTPVNVSGIAASITYRVTPIGPGPDNCAGAPQTFSLTVNPEPVLNLSNKELCSKEPAAYEIQLNPSNLPSSTMFRWAAPVMSDGSVQGTGTGGSFIPMGPSGTFHINTAFINTTSAQITATYVIEAQAGACASSQPVAARTLVLTIDPAPVGGNQTTSAVCSNSAYSFDPQVISINAAGGNNVPSTFTWTATYDAGLTGGATSGAGNLTATLTNSTTGSLSAHYVVTPTSVSGPCAGATFIINVPVSPQPVATAKTTSSVCSTTAFSFDPQAIAVNATGGNNVPSTFTWTAAYDPALSGGIATGSGNISGTLSNVSGSVANAVFTVTPKAITGGCVGAAFIITVPINSEPVATDKSATAVCSNTAFSYDPQAIAMNGPGGNSVPSTFTWTAAYDAGLTGGASTGSGNVAGTLVNLTGGVLNAVYTITPKSTTGLCIGSPFKITVPINPQPVATVKTTPSVCSNDSFDFDPQLISLNGAGGNHVPSSFTWTAAYDAGLTGGVSSGAGDITGVLTNLKSSVLNATFNVTPLATAGSCPGVAFKIVVPINPQPVATAKVATAVCSKTAYTLNPQTLGVNGSGGNSVVSTFDWTANYDAGLTGGTNSGSGNITDNLTNLTSGVLKAVYSVTPTSTSGSCQGNSFTITISINPQPVATNKTMTAVCSKAPFSFDPQAVAVSAAGGNNVLSTFTWTASYDPGLTGGAASGSGNLTGTLVNLTGGQLNAVYKVTPKATTGTCPGTAFFITVPVNPEPVATAKVTAAVCSGTAYNFNPQVVGINGAGGNSVASTFAWTAAYDPALTAGTTAGTGNISGNVINTTGGALNVVYTIIPTATTGSCPGSNFTITVPISPEPAATDKTAPVVCSNTAYSVDPQTLAVSGSGGNSVISTFTWTAVYDPGLTGGLANGTGNVSGSVGNVTGGVLNAVYTVTPKSVASGCIGSTFKITVPINPEPKAIAKITPAVCSNSSFSMDPQAVSINATGGNAVASTFTWTAVYDVGLTGGVASGTGNISGTLGNVTTGSLNAIFTVTAKAQTGGCPGVPFTITVPVSPQPVGVAKTAGEVCSNSSFSYDPQVISINVAGGNNVVSTFTWSAAYDAGLTGGASSGTGNITGTLVNVTSGALNAVFTVTPSSASGVCPGLPFKITVPVNPSPVGIPSTQTAICSGVTTNVNFGALISNGVTSVFKYTLTADFAADLSPVVNPGTFDRTVKSAANSSEKFSNYSTHDVTLTYTVTPYSSVKDCAGTPFIVKVVYHPEPVGTNVTDPNCNSNLNHSIQTQITNSITSIFTYTVSSSNEAAVPTPPALDRTAPTDAFITDSFVNTSGSLVTVTYTITAYNKAFPSCAGATTFTYNVTISPKPVGISDLKAARCSDETFTIDPQGNISPNVASTFTWNATYDGLPIPSGTGVITASFNNKSNTVKQVVYTITPTAVGSGCIGSSFTITVPVNGEPVIDPSLAIPVPICSTNSNGPNPTNIVLSTISTSVTAASYNVKLRSKDPLLVGTPTTGTGLTQNAIKGDTYRNTSSAQLKVIYAIVPIATTTGCVGDTVNVVVLVNPEPVVDPSTANPVAVCSQDKTNITFTTAGSSVAAASYVFMSVTVPTGLVAGGSNALPTLIDDTRPADVLKNDTYTNQTAGVLIVDYKIMPKSGQGCFGEPFVIHQAINAEPILAATPASVCSGLPTGVTITNAAGTTPIASYEYVSVLIPAGITADGSNVLPGVYTSGSFLSTDKFTYSGTGTSPKFVTYFIKPTSVTGSCPSKATQQIQVQILPSPGVADGLDAILCSTSDVYGKNLNFASTGPAALSYKIVPVIDPGLNPVVFNPAPRIVNTTNDIAGDKFTNPTDGPLKVIYNVTPYTAINGGGCEGAVKQITVIIEPTITADPNPNDAVCSSDGVTVNTNIKLTSKSVPTAGPVTFNYTAVSSIGAALMTGFQASASNLAQGYVINDRLVNSSNTSATVTYTITPIANGAKGGAACNTVPAVATQTVVITVDPKPKVVPSTISQTVCYNAPTSITLNSPTTPSAGTIQFTITSVVPEPGLTLASPATPKTVYAPGEVIADLWKNDNADQLPHSVVYTIVPSVSGGLGCAGDAKTVTINVNPQPLVSGTGPGSICSNDVVDILLTSTVDGTINKWTTSIVPAGIVSGASNGSGDEIFQTLKNTGTVPATVTYTITPKANNCTGVPLVIDVVVNPIPVIGALPKTTDVCYGNTFSMPLTSSVTPTVFSWTVDPAVNNSIPAADATGTGSSISQVMKNTGDSEDILTYTITPTGPGGCPGRDVIINVISAPKDSVAILNTESWICAGQKDYLQLQLYGQGPFTFTYSVNGVIQPTVTKAANFKSIAIQPTETTTYKIESMTDALGCSYTGTMPVYVLNVSNFVTAFTYAPSNTATSPVLIGGHSSVRFKNMTTTLPDNDPNVVYTWDFGEDATPATLTTQSKDSIFVDYSSQGQKIVTLSVTNTASSAAGVSCDKQVTQMFVVKLLPLVAGYDAAPEKGCVPSDIVISNNISTGDVMSWILYRQGSQYQTSQADEPVFHITDDGDYTLSFTTSDSQSGQTATTADRKFEFYNAPYADFITRPNDAVFVPDTKLMVINNSSADATDFHWDYGDGQSADGAQPPDHVYQIEGRYLIILTASADHGDGVVCSDTASHIILAKQGGVSKIPNAFTPDPNGPSTQAGGTGRLYDIFLPNVKGVEEYNLQIYDRWGNMLFESNSSTQGWDGYKDGKMLPAGVYVYKLTLRLSDGQRTTQVGDVTLIR